MSVSAVIGSGKMRRLENVEPALLERVSLRERSNLYNSRSLSLTQNEMTKSMRVEDWEKIWGLKDTKSLLGNVRGLLPYEPQRQYPLDELYNATNFRLADGSPGKGAGEGGRDLGADVDMVGPGPAYERWKKTPAYLQWLKDTGQVK
jgi:hypothetical protein